MNGRGRLNVWARIGLAFVLGLVAGFVLDYVVGPHGQAGTAVAIAAALALFASLLAASLPEFFTRAREHRLFLREHADLLFAQVYSPIQSIGTTIFGQQLTAPGLAMDLLRQGVPDWGYRDPVNNSIVPVSELANWNLAKSHFESDPALSASFKRTWERLERRVSRKGSLDKLYLKKIGEAVDSEYGSGFLAAWTFTVPEPPRWFNAPVITQWLRVGTLGYDFTEQVAGTQHRILGGSMIILTSDQPFSVPAQRFSHVVSVCADDPELRAAWTNWLVEDAEDQEQLEGFLRLVKHAGERIQATHDIPGRCEVCSG